MQVELDWSALARLMPMALWLDAAGRIRGMGPTVARLTGAAETLTEAFALDLPDGLSDGADRMAALRNAGRVQLRAKDGTVLRGVSVPDGAGGMVVNLSFGLGVVDAVRRYGLTEADFAATELTVELLYLVEAKTAVTEELRRLNARIDRARARAEAEAQSDALTGIGNRRALMAALEGMVAAGRHFGLIHLDLDHFKAVNDRLGHAAGDRVLAEAARILAAETRAGDAVARIGGDEFVLLLPSVPDATRLERVAARLVERIAAPMLVEGEEVRVGAPLGCLVAGAHRGLDAEALLAKADAALYAAKRAGRGCARLTQA